VYPCAKQTAKIMQNKRKSFIVEVSVLQNKLSVWDNNLNNLTSGNNKLVMMLEKICCKLFILVSKVIYCTSLKIV